MISRGDGHLIVKLSFRPTPLVIEPISPTEFLLPHTDGRFTFQHDNRAE